ncbi:MAG: hypothetical protein IPL99_11310 [Candidatus Competibacteraceae bacterium]|nr:hypothetical protein [Candidatus Competibacteraceae bacterium]
MRTTLNLDDRWFIFSKRLFDPVPTEKLLPTLIFNVPMTARRDREEKIVAFGTNDPAGLQGDLRN